MIELLRKEKRVQELVKYYPKYYDLIEYALKLEIENQQLKKQLEASEKAKQDAIHCIRTELLCFDNESVEYIEGLKILNILNTDKGE